ncbi:hypothetical protein [Candidatus Chloroploca sp. Khr17]|uniref:hypothetical protein n=1 Tax=Candidatus Chloroploca sp. Khr17 TaxID=2496869 RepID=UPI00101DBDBC|nr:hypothetical protein [Candidatus Chloroploca sp. Khr17]
MAPSLTPHEFVAKWSGDTRKERSVSQEHFLDLCRLVGHETPGENRDGTLVFEAGAAMSDDPRVTAISAAAQRLVAQREAWLNEPGLSEAELKQRTLTKLCNQRPPWLDQAHTELDQAVCDAYG